MVVRLIRILNLGMWNEIVFRDVKFVVVGCFIWVVLIWGEYVVYVYYF